MGTLSYEPAKDGEPARWVLDLSPSAAMKARRVFQRGTWAATRLTISATPANAADVEWFRSRYPLRELNRTRVRSLAKRHRERLQATEDLVAGRGRFEAAELAKPARDYQKHGAAFWHGVGGLLLADDLGLGKTVTALAGLADPSMRPAAVVCDLHLVRQWAAKVREFLPGWTVRICESGKKLKPLADPLTKTLPDVCIVTPGRLSNWAAPLAKVCRSVVIDESHGFRHADTGKYRAAGVLLEGVERRLGMTATPMFNYGDELWAMMDLLRPGELGTRDEFVREWCRYQGSHHVLHSPEALADHMRREGLMLRRTREDVGREVPAVERVRFEATADAGAFRSAAGPAAELARLVLDQTAEPAERGRAGAELERLLREATGIAKAREAAALAEMLIEQGEPVVMAGWHHAVYAIWREILGKYEPAFVTGKQDGGQKAEAVERFTSGETDLLVLSLRSGAGIDGLQHRCRSAVIGELDWTPAVDEQFIGRIARDGQQRNVVAYYVVSSLPTDEIMEDVRSIKEQQIRGLRGDAAPAAPVVDEDRVRKLAEAYLKG